MLEVGEGFCSRAKIDCIEVNTVGVMVRKYSVRFMFLSIVSKFREREKGKGVW